MARRCATVVAAAVNTAAPPITQACTNRSIIILALIVVVLQQQDSGSFPLTFWSCFNCCLIATIIIIDTPLTRTQVGKQRGPEGAVLLALLVTTCVSGHKHTTCESQVKATYLVGPVCACTLPASGVQTTS